VAEFNPHAARRARKGQTAQTPARTPQKPPKLPRKSPPWSRAARRRWDAWWTSGRAGMLDAAGVEALIALVGICDAAELATSDSMRLKLTKGLSR
jgi:hypothetical protein